LALLFWVKALQNLSKHKFGVRSLLPKSFRALLTESPVLTAPGILRRKRGFMEVVVAIATVVLAVVAVLEYVSRKAR